MDIGNAIIVITGGSKGLGKALACAFLEEGGKVIIASQHKEDLTTAAAETGAESVVCDVTKESDIQHLAAEVLDAHGRIDIWVNNAGVWLPHAPIEETDWRRVHEIFEVNFFGTVYGSKAALMQMRTQGSGTIMNILSTSALEGRPGSSGYCASKYAASGFTKSLRKEVEGTGIQVFGIYPGAMQTHLFDEQKPPEIDRYMLPDFVASKIIENLRQPNLEKELVIRQP